MNSSEFVKQKEFRKFRWKYAIFIPALVSWHSYICWEFRREQSDYCIFVMAEWRAGKIWIAIKKFGKCYYIWIFWSLISIISSIAKYTLESCPMNLILYTDINIMGNKIVQFFTLLLTPPCFIKYQWPPLRVLVFACLFARRRHITFLYLNTEKPWNSWSLLFTTQSSVECVCNSI